jgi:hypothetical protein
MKAALPALLFALVVAAIAGAGAPARTTSAPADTVAATAVPAAWAQDQMGVAGAWAAGGSARTGPVVAVLDTGVAPVSDLDGALVPGFDAIGGGETRDDNGHGTAVASVIAGKHDGVGAEGVCPTCRIMPLKIAGADGRAPDVAQAAAITWAVDHGATLLSISFVGLDPGGPVGDAIASAIARGVTVVAAAGNEATTDRRWPAAYDPVVAVGATDENGGLAGFSNRGSSWVDLLAPGCADSMNPQQQTVLFCGTSVATPMASGSLALLKSLAPGLSYDAIVGALESTAVPVAGDAARFGRLDVAAAMRALGLQPAPTVALAVVTERTLRTLASRVKKTKRRAPVPV